jgi:hypothetical protein
MDNEKQYLCADNTSATDAAMLALEFIISIITRDCFIAAIVNRNSRL